MKTKNLILTTMMILFTIGMTGCNKNDDRLFDEKELIEENPKDDDEFGDEDKNEPEEVDLNEKYPLGKWKYKEDFIKDIADFVKLQYVNVTNLNTRNPEVLNFLETNQNLRGYLYRMLGEETLFEVEDLIKYLGEAVRDINCVGAKTIVKMYQTDNTVDGKYRQSTWYHIDILYRDSNDKANQIQLIAKSPIVNDIWMLDDGFLRGGKVIR